PLHPQTDGRPRAAAMIIPETCADSVEAGLDVLQGSLEQVGAGFRIDFRSEHRPRGLDGYVDGARANLVDSLALGAGDLLFRKRGATGDIVLRLLLRFLDERFSLAARSGDDFGCFLLGFLALALEFGQQLLGFLTQAACLFELVPDAGGALVERR